MDWKPGGIRSMRSPCDIQTTVDPSVADALEEIAAVVDREISPAIFPMLGLGHLPTREMRHKLHPVANAENGNPLVEEFLGHRRRFLLIDAGGAARQHDALRAIGENSCQGNGARAEFVNRLGLRECGVQSVGCIATRSRGPEFYCARVPSEFVRRKG